MIRDPENVAAIEQMLKDPAIQRNLQTMLQQVVMMRFMYLILISIFFDWMGIGASDLDLDSPALVGTSFLSSIPGY